MHIDARDIGKAKLEGASNPVEVRRENNFSFFFLGRVESEVAAIESPIEQKIADVATYKFILLC